MKRLPGLIGIVYLFVLAVVFYFYGYMLLCVVCALALAFACSGLVMLMFKKNRDFCIRLIAGGVTALTACASVVIYTNAVYMPIIDDYADKELKINGYVCDEVRKSVDSFECVIKTDTINGRDETVKIKLSSYADLELEAFDEVCASVYARAAGSNTLLSKNIFLTAYADGKTVIERTGQKRFDILGFAVTLRSELKRALDCLLPEDYSALCKAVSLGDKKALPFDVQRDFLNTGTTFLIVVSGMHLAVIASFTLFVVKLFTRRKRVRCAAVIIVSLLFMVLTGFTPSIMRAGIMQIVALCSSVFLRKYDSLNSIGAAAVLLTVFTPFAAGDIGMLLSFSATLGIVLWADSIREYIVSKLNPKRFRRLCMSAAELFAVSLSAALWVMPITVVAFHRLSPFTAIISTIIGPLVSLLIIFSFAAAVLYLLPLVSAFAYPFALAAGLLAKIILFVISLFAQIPYCSVNTDRVYFYIWLAVTVALTVVGFALKKKGFYIRCSAAFSLTVLIVGWAAFAFLTSGKMTVTVYGVERGVTAIASQGNNMTVLSCGGEASLRDDIADKAAEKFAGADSVIIPSQEKGYCRFQSLFINEFDAANVLVYDKDRERQEFAGGYERESRRVFGDNVHFTLNISDGITDDVINVRGVTYQFVKGEKSLLFVPCEGDIADLPEQYRSADYLLVDGVPDNPELVSADKVIFSGTEEQLGKSYNDLMKLNCDLLSTSGGDVTVSLSD